MTFTSMIQEKGRNLLNKFVSDGSRNKPYLSAKKNISETLGQKYEDDLKRKNGINNDVIDVKARELTDAPLLLGEGVDGSKK